MDEIEQMINIVRHRMYDTQSDLCKEIGLHMAVSEARNKLKLAEDELKEIQKELHKIEQERISKMKFAQEGLDSLKNHLVKNKVIKQPTIEAVK